jgi:hypothetical protein
LAIIRHQLKKAHPYNLDIVEVSSHIPAKKHASLISKFLCSPHAGVLLLSTNTCAVGINLQQVSEVIFIKSSWNPATNCQAMCHVWRFGQQNSVQVTHLLICGTVNQHILATITTHNREANKFDSHIQTSHANQGNHLFHVPLSAWAEMSHAWARARKDHKLSYLHACTKQSSKLQSTGAEQIFDHEFAAL